jgi:hypothetical protein
MAIDWSKVATLYEQTSMTQQEIGDAVGCGNPTISVWAAAHYSTEYRRERKRKNYAKSKLGSKNPGFGKTGALHSNYKGNCSDCKGYILTLKPAWYMGRTKSKHIFKHHEVYCLDRGITEVPVGMHIHHINGDPLDNSKENLIMLSAGDHTRLHKGLKNMQNLSNKEREE